VKKITRQWVDTDLWMFVFSRFDCAVRLY